MTPRRVAALAGVLAAAAILLVPSTGHSDPPPRPSPPPAAEGVEGPRCDPQPERGSGPPPGRGTKKCASA